MRVVVVGGSWGGLDAAERLLTLLPPEADAAVVLVLHRSPRSTDGLLEELLRRELSLPVVGVEDQQPLLPGRVYVGPADYHLLVDEGLLALSTDEPVRHSRPSIDVLFESAADAYGPQVVAVLLTGANEDGADGLRRVKSHGGTTLVQDPATAERPQMPLAGVATGCADVVAPLEDLARLLRDLVTPSSAGSTR